MSQILLIAALTCLGLLPWGNRAIQLLLDRGIGKNIRFDGPASHQIKAGTATMGGLYFLAGILVVSVAVGLIGFGEVWVPLLATLSFGALGAYDDLEGLKDRQGVGWLAGAKFWWQWILGLIVSLIAYLMGAGEATAIVLGGRALAWGLWVIPTMTVLLVAISNAVNLTDGVDGLASSTMIVAMSCYAVLAFGADLQGIALYAAITAGALMAFLWFNTHPAHVFMGDTGSQALGAGLAAVAVLSGQWLVLPLVGIVFVLEALSVIVQVAYFKYTKRRTGEGQRILRMSPLHHHFELGGWSESQIVFRFTLVGAVGAALAAIIIGTG